MRPFGSEARVDWDVDLGSTFVVVSTEGRHRLLPRRQGQPLARHGSRHHPAEDRSTRSRLVHGYPSRRQTSYRQERKI